MTHFQIQRFPFR